MVAVEQAGHGTRVSEESTTFVLLNDLKTLRISTCVFQNIILTNSELQDIMLP